VTELAKRFGEVIRAERKSRNLSQERLADLAGLDRTQVQRLERGLYNPKLETIERLARALQKFPSELIALADGSEEENGDYPGED
jgi:transcriptional regulator with XRE-family HTH domain